MKGVFTRLCLCTLISLSFGTLSVFASPYYINKNGTISESTNLSTWTQIATGHYSTYGNDSSKSWFICETL